MMTLLSWQPTTADFLELREDIRWTVPAASWTVHPQVRGP
jgi:hypothetical protein